MESSRVGEMIIAPVPFRAAHFILERSSTTGTRKASVLPDPVFAAATTSLPAKRGGIARDWMCVIFTNRSLLRAHLVASDIGRSSKGWLAKNTAPLFPAPPPL